jgi:hypothetical protein
MKKTNRMGFIDRVTGDHIRYWKDKYGQEFMAVNKFGFRVKV